MSAELCVAPVRHDGKPATCGHSRDEHHEGDGTVSPWCGGCLSTVLRGGYNHAFLTAAPEENDHA